MSRLRAVMGDLGFPLNQPEDPPTAFQLNPWAVRKIDAAIAEDDRALWTPGQDIEALLRSFGDGSGDPAEIRRLLQAAHDLCGAFREFADGFQARLAAALQAVNGRAES